MSSTTARRPRPDIRQITRLVPAEGNLVQGQSELAIDRELAAYAAEEIAASHNHYAVAEGVPELRRAIAEKIKAVNGIDIDPEARPATLSVTSGGTGALVALAQAHLRGKSVLVFGPYYSYHRIIFEQLGGGSEVFDLEGDDLVLDGEALAARCRELKARPKLPLGAIIVASPANPTGKIFTAAELSAIGALCRELDLICIADEVYEHFVATPGSHVSMAALPGMGERTVTVNSFSKSWNISGWRLGYMFGPAHLVAPAIPMLNVFYVCAATPLQRALARAPIADPRVYARQAASFAGKREFVASRLRDLGFALYESGSSFYIWARTPRGSEDAYELNERLIRSARVAGVPGAAFTDLDEGCHWMRFCVAREDHILESATARLAAAFRPSA